MRSAGKALRISCLPNPHQVNLLQMQMNSQLEELIGNFYGIQKTFVVPANPKAKSNEPVAIELNRMKSFFADVTMVQATMVRLYGITPEGMCFYRSTMQNCS